MKILAIETSCDDTCAALLEIKNNKPKILSNIVSSQIKIHRKWGGVYPALAKREHQKNLAPVLFQAIKEAKLLKPKNSKNKKPDPPKNRKLEKILEREAVLFAAAKKFFEKYKKPDIDLVAVTIGPGLEPCLWVGVNFAKAVGFYWKIPIVPINHIEAHIASNWLKQADSRPEINKIKIKKNTFPAICLVASGGHTQLILMQGVNKYQIIGETKDDAAGECLDKTAKILGLGYPGGPIVSKFAAQFRPIKKSFSIKLPRPMIYQKNYDFSFSGLKTAILYNFKSVPLKTRKSKQYIRNICAEAQQSVIDVLIYKTLKAAKNHKAKSVILGGGVTANKELRKQFQERIKKELPGVECIAPDQKFSTDNAAMVAITGYFRRTKKTKNFPKLKAEANLRLPEKPKTKAK